MREHIAPAVYYLELHLLFASIVCLAAWGLTSRWHSNATRNYWIWVATSLNFVIPVGGFFDRFGATSVSWATQLAGFDTIGMAISRHLTAGAALLGIWLLGVALMVGRLLVRISHGRADELVGPCVNGLWRPRIILPDGLEGLLTEAELDAVLIHETTHAKRRDNLIGLLHELALCGLWFHPLVWLTGARLGLFRELSCDDAVIASTRGADLVAALAKLAIPEHPHPVRAGAASLFSQRIARLTTSRPQRTSGGADWLLIAVFVGIFLSCALGTVAHNPGCFKVDRVPVQNL